MTDSINVQRRWIGGTVTSIRRGGVTQGRQGGVYGEISFLIGVDREYWLDDGPRPMQPFSQRYMSPSMSTGLDHVFDGQQVDFDVTSWDDARTGEFQTYVHAIVDRASGATIWQAEGRSHRVYRR